MNKDQIKGSIKSATGKIQQKFGEVIDSPSQQAKGIGKQAEGEIQQVTGDAKELIKDVKKSHK